MDFKAVGALAVTVGLVALGVIALLKGHTELAITFATLLVPSAGQVLHPASATVTSTPESTEVKVKE